MNDRLRKAMERDPFLEGSNVDLSGFPSLMETKAQSMHDERFAPLVETDIPGALRRIIPEFVNSNRNDAEIASIMRESGLRDEGQPSEFHLADGSVGLVWQGSDTWIAKVGEKRFTAPTRDGAMMRAARATQRIERPLSTAEELKVERLAANNQLQEALGEYLWYRLGENDKISPSEVLNNPRYRSITDEAVWFVWRVATSDYPDTPEAERFIVKFTHGRPLTLRLLDQAWFAYKTAPNESDPQTNPEDPDFDSMSDEEIARLRSQVLRERARGHYRR